MAEKLDDIEVVDETSGDKSKKILIIIIAVLTLALIGGGVMMFLGGDSDEVVSDASTDVEATSSVKQSPIYFAIKKPLVLNFSAQSGGTVRYLQLKLEVMARDKAVIDAVKQHLPAIKHAVLILLLSQKYDTLTQADGSDVLQQQVFTTVNKILTSHKSGKVEAVYTDLIMQ